MKAAVILKNKLAREKPVLGLLAAFHFWPGMVEIAINAGLDYLLIDQEHLTHDAAAVAAGPYDLSADLGICWQPDHPLLHASIERIREAGMSAGKPMWMIGNPADLIRRGFKFICVGQGAMLLQSTLKTMVAQSA